MLEGSAMAGHRDHMTFCAHMVTQNHGLKHGAWFDIQDMLSHVAVRTELCHKKVVNRPQSRTMRVISALVLSPRPALLCLAKCKVLTHWGMQKLQLQQYKFRRKTPGGIQGKEEGWTSDEGAPSGLLLTDKKHS